MKLCPAELRKNLHKLSLAYALLEKNQTWKNLKPNNGGVLLFFCTVLLMVLVQQ